MDRWGAIFALFVAIAGLIPGAAFAVGVPLDGRVCHVVTPAAVPDGNASTLRFTCGGEPSGYQRGSLWLRIDPARYMQPGETPTLLVHHSRLDRLAVEFRYVDGPAEWQQVRNGAYGDFWRPGAQLAFSPANRNDHVAAIVLRFDRLASHHLLRVRLVPSGAAERQSAMLAALIGAALTLLAIGAIYNLSLAIAVRRQYLAWQGAWAATVFVWGTLWSQFALLVVPGFAGSFSAQASTFLSANAITLATFSAVTSIPRSILPNWLRGVTLALGAAVGILGIPTSLVRSALIDTLGAMLGIFVLADLLAVAICLGWAVRRGSAEARDLVAAWSVPMAALALTQFVDLGSALWGGGAQILVLFAAAWQTIWLSIAASRRLARFRAERDRALAAEARASELATRDPLTGIHNRRGFVAAVAPLMQSAQRDQTPVALLLIDIDRFKTINDVHGHEVGDSVLCTLADRLTRWQGPMCATARLGGEEFALMIGQLEGRSLLQFAEHVRQELGACDHRQAIGDHLVTVSIGVAERRGTADYQQLYRLADQALYVAKDGGRNRVIHADYLGPPCEPHSGKDGAQARR